MNDEILEKWYKAENGLFGKADWLYEVRLGLRWRLFWDRDWDRIEESLESVWIIIYEFLVKMLERVWVYVDS